MAQQPREEFANIDANLVAMDNTVPQDFYALTDEGQLRIQIVYLEGLPQQQLDRVRVRLFSKDGTNKVASVARDGLVRLGHVESGPHGIVVTGPGIYAAVGVYVSEKAANEEAVTPYQLPVIPVSNDTQIRAYTSYMPYEQPHYDYHDYVDFENTTTRPKHFYRTQLSQDGVLRGRVYAIAGQKQNLDRNRTDVVIYQAGKQIQRVSPEANGWFKVPSLKPGVYYVTATSWLGYSAFSFEVSANSGPGESLVSTTLTTSAQATEAPLEILLMPRQILSSVQQEVEADLNERSDETPVDDGTPIAETGGMTGGGGTGGGGTGGGGSGSGSGGGGGGAAGLAAIAGTAALAAAANDSDDGGTPIVPPAMATPNTVEAGLSN
ncbi:hypothetical protein [Stieleria varia]|nr:hypothetical protein [Stieleria varia]